MEDLTAMIIAEPQQYYAISVYGYIEPTNDDTAVLSVRDDQGIVYGRSTFRTIGGMCNAHMQMMTNNFDGTVVLYVELENANWVLDSIVQPRLDVRRVQ